MGWDSFDAAGKRVVTTPTTVVPCCRANRTANQSVNSATVTYVALNAADSYDTDTMHDPSTNNTRITFNTAGVYQLYGEIQYEINTTGVRYAFFDANGTATRIATFTILATAGVIVQVSAQYKFAVNEYIELGAFQDSGGALNVFNCVAAAVRVATG